MNENFKMVTVKKGSHAELMEFANRNDRSMSGQIAWMLKFFKELPAKIKKQYGIR